MWAPCSLFSPAPGLAPLQKRRHSLLVVPGHARQRELVDIHVAGEVVERIGKPVDGQRCHCSRQRRLEGKFLGKRHRGFKIRPETFLPSLILANIPDNADTEYVLRAGGSHLDTGGWLRLSSRT